MLEAAEAVLQILHKNKFKAHYIGGKCRNELHNSYHSSKKVIVKDIDIVTNATTEKIESMFSNCELRGEAFQVAVVEFGGFEFEIATYRKDIYDNKKGSKPTTKVAKTLDEDRERRDYTINAIAQDVEGNYIDYTYKYRNKKISAMKDIEDGIIRAIGNPKQRYEEDPLRILRAFRFVAQLGYDIENQTLKTISNNLYLVEKIPHERIKDEMNKLVIGQFASKAFKLMKEINFFDVKIFNSIQDEKREILSGIKELDDEYLDRLDILNKPRKQLIDPIDVWSYLFKPLGSEKAKENAESIQILNNVDIEKLEWIIDHYDMIDVEDYKHAIYNSRTGVVKRLGLPCMREMVLRISKVHNRLDSEMYKEKKEKFMYAFCCRPYFPEQLKVTGEEMMEMADEGPGPWISLAKDKLILKLIECEKFPIGEDRYTELVLKSVEEAIFEEEMRSTGLI